MNAKIKQFARRLFGPEQLSTHGDHFLHLIPIPEYVEEWGEPEIPIGEPYAPNGWGKTAQYDSEGCYYDRES